MTEHPASPDEIRIGFMALQETERGYRGALLLTDRNGAPVEFRCTSPVSPTRMQRILYGKTLVPHIAQRLVGLPLIEAVTTRPTVLVSQDNVFLGLRDFVTEPVVCVRQRIAESSAVQNEEEGPFGFVTLEANAKHHEDVDAAREMIRDCEDLLDPFERIEQALELDEERSEEPPR